MRRLWFSAILALLVSACAWAQDGRTLSAGRPASRSMQVTHPLTLNTDVRPVPAPFGVPTPQRFDASPFPNQNRDFSSVIRRNFFPSHHDHVVVPVYVFVPYAPYPYVYSYGVDSQNANGGSPAESDPYANQSPSSAAPQSNNLAGQLQAASDTSAVMFQSGPEGADIIVDGNFIGNTPSTVRLSAGDHVISIEKAGFQSYQRTVTVTAGGVISINATLDAQ